MNITFGDTELTVRSLTLQPRQFKLNDIVMGPYGALLKVVTIQPGCPIFESNKRTKCAVVFETEGGMIVPDCDVRGTFTIYRPKRKA